MQNGDHNPTEQNPLNFPESARTYFVAGPIVYHFDEEIEEVESLIESFLLTSRQFLHLTADHRPILIGRRVVEGIHHVMPIPPRSGLSVASRSQTREFARR